MDHWREFGGVDFSLSNQIQHAECGQSLMVGLENFVSCDHLCELFMSLTILTRLDV